MTYADVLTNNTIGCLSAVYDTEKVGKVYMPERRGTREDMVTWLKVLAKCSTDSEKRSTRSNALPYAVWPGTAF